MPIASLFEVEQDFPDEFYLIDKSLRHTALDTLHCIIFPQRKTAALLPLVPLKDGCFGKGKILASKQGGPLMDCPTAWDR